MGRLPGGREVVREKWSAGRLGRHRFAKHGKEFSLEGLFKGAKKKMMTGLYE